MRERMVFLKDDSVPEYKRDLYFLEQKGWRTRVEIELDDPDQVLLYLEREVVRKRRHSTSIGRRKNDAGPRHRL